MLIKTTFVTAVLLLGGGMAFANQDSIGVQEKDGEKYIVHQISEGQDLSYLSDRYKVEKEEIREANSDVGEVQVYDHLLIPYDEENYEEASTESAETSAEESSGQETQSAENSSERKTHTVETGQTLFSIGQKYDVSLDKIREWNDIEGNDIGVGQELYVEPPRQDGSSESPPEQEEDNQEKAEMDEDKIEDTDKKKAESGDDQEDPSLITQEGKAGWMESDGSALGEDHSLAVHDKAPTGTIIKVTNLMNDEVAYVRVVGDIPSSPDNQDLIIKISEAAAKKLDVRDPYFRTKLEYSLNESS